MGRSTEIKERRVSEETTPPTSSDSEEEEETEEYTVEKILDHRYVC